MKEFKLWLLKEKTILSAFVHECVCVVCLNNESDRNKETEEQKAVSVCIRLDGEGIVS